MVKFLMFFYVFFFPFAVPRLSETHFPMPFQKGSLPLCEHTP